MMKGKKIRIFSAVFALLGTLSVLAGCKKPRDIEPEYTGSGSAMSKNINQVNKMPDRPTDYKYIDYKKIAQDLDSVLFDFAKTDAFVNTSLSTFTPVGYWINDINGAQFKGKGFGLPSYVGHVDNTGVGTIAINGSGSPESITVMGALYGSTLAGIDKSKQKFDQGGTEKAFNFVNMAKEFYSNEGFVLNRMFGTTGNSFWYEIYPQIQFLRLTNLYPKDNYSEDIILESADKWVEALDYFYDGGYGGKFAWTSLNFNTMQPVISRWVEYPNAGVVFILLNAFERTGEQKYFDAAIEYADASEADMTNEYYEILIDYMCYNMAFMNYKYGTNYNVGKFINNIFDSEDDNRPSGVVNDKWGNYDAYGLMGFDNWGNANSSAYAFAMNTFHIASTLAPMLRYDTRFADDIGKWFLHASNSAKIFYGDNLPDANQSSNHLVGAEIKSAVAYEGVKKSSGGKTPYAMGDPLTHGWGKTDFGVYGGSHVGIFGGLIEKTDVEEILRIDISKCDDFKASGDFQHYLYYNPFDSEKEVTVNLGVDKYCLFDTLSRTKLEASATGAYKLKIAAKSSVILALLPENAKLTTDKNFIMAEDISLAKLKDCAIDVISHTVPKSSVSSTVSTKIKFSAECSEGDSIKNLRITFNGAEIYNGAYIAEFDFDPAVGEWIHMPGSVKEGGRNWNTNPVTYTKQFYEGELIAEITTESGLKDKGIIRLRNNG